MSNARLFTTYASTTIFHARCACAGNPISARRRLNIQTPHEVARVNTYREPNISPKLMNLKYSHTNPGYDARSTKNENASFVGVTSNNATLNVHLSMIGPYGV
jgi:hypothetical protein